MKKLQINQERKNFIKENFSTIKKSSLSGDDLRYYNLVGAGKQRAKNSVRFEGKFISGEIVDIARKIAKAKHISLNKYLDENKEAVRNFIESGYVETSKQIENSIDILLNSKKKTVEVDTGNGIVRMGRKEAIKRLAEFEQHIKTSTNVAMIATHVKVFKTGKIRLTIPDDFEEYDGDELIDYLDLYDGLDYVESKKAD